MSLSFEVAYDWVPPFKLHTIAIINCRVGPGFGVWLRSQTELRDVHLRGNGMSEDSIPEEWLSKISAQVICLILTRNQFPGNLPSHLKFPNSMLIDLSRNNLVGPLPLWSTNASLLYLQSNSFSGPISSDIDQLMPNLEGLYLFENHLNGTIPDSVCNMRNLEVLALRSNQFSGEFPRAWRAGSNLLFVDASHNNLSGNILASLGVLSLLEILKLNNNSFDGKIPYSLQNCSSLRSIDLGDNRLSGNIPLWIGGSNVAMLYMLQLRSNLFTGHIPHNMCNLSHLHILDLSHNNFSGMIPSCLNDLGSLVREDNKDVLHYGFYEQATLTLKGRQHLYNTTLILVKSIDLSSNVLEGEIPKEICSLVLLGTLNLSMNQLTGKIPSKIGNMHLIETLDLSHNHLSGQIPQSLSSLNFLSYLNLSYNNLSGRILSGNQLQTLNDLSIYMGNPLLCGVPLSTQCPGDDLKDAKDKNEDGNDKLWFYVSVVLGFIVGFWGVCGTLVLKTSWRYAYFRFFDDIKDKVMG
ncbi:hypothetical protein C1H46_000593 [Malus baccata]|uniref:Leucine-rich repeat-containing N-terminal plant-type domain-containing protein n=1 Tax=Malus baccata TaxID=106549 RepID=A0A540NRB8_MALBA|nr:hypothetical protein C1H46_000593 [Malus baccata]